MKMRNLLLLIVVVTLAYTQLTAAATLTACTVGYLTSDRTGMADTPTTTPTKCTTATVRTACAGGFNPQCMFSLKFYYYICCYPIAGTAATVLGTVTLPTLDPGTTAVPRNLKPLCPSGSVGFGTSSLACNKTATNAGCPTTYSCVNAANLYDLSGTPTNPLDDSGAANTPQVCCKTQATSDVFLTAGLGTSVIPLPPTTTLASVYFATVPDATIYLGDDYSTTGVLYVSAPADPATAPTLATTVFLKSIVLYSPTALAAATTRYHVLLYDSTTNTNCLFIGNIPGTTVTEDSPNPVITIPTQISVPAAGATTDAQAAFAYVDYITNPATPVLKYSPGATAVRLASLTNTVAHKWVVLVFQTTAALNFGPNPTTAADETKILLGAGRYGDFVPTTDTTAATAGPGPFTTVTAFLSKTKVKTILGKPIAGTYFYITN